MDMVLQQPFYKRQSIGDWLFALLIIAATAYTFVLYGEVMDVYEDAILAGTAIGLVMQGWYWKSFRWYFPLSGALSLLAISMYDHNLARAGESFLLKFLLSSQSSIMWMCTLFFLATVVYFVAMLRRSEVIHQTASGMLWAACVFALTGLFTRWYESYLIAPDVGRIPVTNLYEVFILFCLITALMYLFYEAKFQMRQVGAFVSLIISAAVGFILWYTFDRQAHEIQPLIPALQSWWMKIHVPANFVGYGAFAMSAMLYIAWLLAVPKDVPANTKRLFTIGAGVVFAATVLMHLNAASIATNPDNLTGVGFAAKFGYSLAALLLVAAKRGVLQRFISNPDVLEEVSYRAIAVGFLFFTIATILGAMWAADAWGGYWSWDPKETWALIVWLNYAAWLHIRLVKGWRGEPLAWWAVVGLFITTFAFIGVNMFLTGLHSYGAL